MIYFDNAATTKPITSAIQAAISAAKCYGNPSSTHIIGRNASDILKESRRIISDALGCEPFEFYFMPSGTVANNIAVLGTAYCHIRRSKRIVSTDSEHPSIELPLRRLASEGFEIIRISTKGGILNYDILRNALSEPTSLVTIMQANNETGAVYDIQKVKQIMNDTPSGALLHSDTIQGFMKADNITKYCDMLSISAHKIGGFKGCGGLYLKKGIRINSLIDGGGQEMGLHSGTEPMPAIAAFAAAVEEWAGSHERKQYIAELRYYLIERLNNIIGVSINIPQNPSINIVSISLEGVRSEVALNYLSSVNICVSSGSACSQKKRESRVLTAFGLSKPQAEGTIRISLSYTNTKAEIDRLCDELNTIIRKYSMNAGRVNR
ncbi:MAG: hypothetical protein A2Y17_06330 [Clostridiales bacterium GWF2_38_85]|nr:MAG: hypothetical protein A2Y17_06330 [Clostridiales bacterium GWF2_38_85]